MLPCLFLFITDIKCHCMMGLFPTIGRAWLTIDSDIYVSIAYIALIVIRP